MKRKIIGSLSIIMGVIMIASGFAMAFEQGSAFALEVVCTVMWLEIISSGSPLFDAGNMYPGDTEEAGITVRNQGEKPFYVMMGMERVDKAPAGPDLFDRLEMKITYLGNVAYEEKISGFSSCELGNFEPGDSRRLNISVHLPGPETGNEFQGKSVSVKFVFTAHRDRPPGPPGREERPEGARLVIAKQVLDAENNDLSDLEPYRSEVFHVRINGGEPVPFSAGKPVVLNGLQAGGSYTIEEVAPDPDSDYVCLTGPVTVTVAPGTEYVVIKNRYRSEINVEPEPPKTGGEDEEKEITVEPELPRTGGPEVYLLILGLLLILVGFKLQAEAREN